MQFSELKQKVATSELHISQLEESLEAEQEKRHSAQVVCERSEDQANEAQNALAEAQCQLERNAERMVALQNELKAAQDDARTPKNNAGGQGDILSPDQEELLLDLDEQRDKVCMLYELFMSRVCDVAGGGVAAQGLCDQ